MMITVLIDNGHGKETPGKRSPDGRLLEWAWTRRVARRLKARLEGAGVRAVLLVPEDNDVPLGERCRRANAFGRDAVLVSIHVNAAGNGSAWTAARGFSVFVAPACSEKSKALARRFTSLALERGLTGNRCVPAALWWPGNFAICRDTVCPAVLTENLFQDNADDVEFLLSARGEDAIVNLHFDALTGYREGAA